MVYMISYDLNQPGQDYPAIMETIESLGTWCRYLKSTYLLKSDLSIETIESKITQNIDKSDKVIICQVVKPIRGWLSQEQWDWINANL